MGAPSHELNFELSFASEVLKLNSLHYGYWDEGTASGKIDLDELREAQARFTSRLLSHVPDGVQTVLDVGAGIGDNARELAARGRRVTAISPDKNHERYYSKDLEPRLTFHRSTYEQFRSSDRFDLLLFSESHNYFPHDVGLEKSRRLVRSGGYLLISGIFWYPGRVPFPRDFDLQDLEYLSLARANGFTPRLVVDITPNVLPTVEMAHRAMRDYLEPFGNLVESFMETRAPWRARLLKAFFSKQRRYLAKEWDYYKRKMDPGYFRDRIRYVTVLLEDTKAEGL
jgi:MPBQ/MSBQ methyltransferase